MGLAHEKKNYLQEKANLFEIGSLIKYIYFTESLILAQNERWRHGLGMQVERTTSVESSGRVRNA